MSKAVPRRRQHRPVEGSALQPTPRSLPVVVQLCRVVRLLESAHRGWVRRHRGDHTKSALVA
eukprot:7717730-Heterocapsa_arctica.AAC.1